MFSFFGSTKTAEKVYSLKNPKEEVILPMSHDTKEKILKITSRKTDTVLFSVIEKFLQRSDLGLQKYGTNLDRKDLDVLDWIQHAQEEHMDAILYLEKLKQIFEKDEE